MSMTIEQLKEFVISKMNEAEECLREIDTTLTGEIVTSTNFDDVVDMIHLKESTKSIFDALYNYRLPI